MVRKIGDYSYEKSFHILLLALHQQMPEVVFKGWKWSGFVNFLLEKPDSHRCSIHQLLQATREYGIPIQFVSEIELIPQSLQAILDDPTGLETAKRTPKRPPTSSPANYGPPNFGPCLAPWCESYRKNDAMVLTPKKAGWHLCAACTSCSMQYGRKRATSEWCARTKDILFMWEKIFPLLQEGRTNAEIGRLLGTDKRTILRAQAYFAYHKIGSLKSHKMFDEIVTPTDIVACFEKLVNEDTDELKMQRRASKTFGWSQRCFYYFLAHAEVQAMLRNHQRSPSKEPGMRHEVKTITGTQDVFAKMVEQELYRMMKDGDPITQKTVAARLGCGVQTLRRHGLAKSISEAGKYQAELAAASETMSVRHQINRLLAVGEMQRSVVTLKLIEQSMQMSMNTLRHSSPTLFQWIQTELRKHRERVRVLVVDDYKELIKTIVEDVRMEHGRVLVTKVVERLDVNYITLLRTFPEVIEFIKEFGRQA
ncbi:hypothetical protein [Alicyclobacillus suci]|uniref:hypothetical protein n=1 Tax=Alicyclobacillus suci TaxID=2816080 RepID=UPI001F36A2BF|nr:hypothetical protein [Alicyclobacillus suci]